MSFINFNNRIAPEAKTYTAEIIAEALYQVETRNKNKIQSIVESIKEPLATAEALSLFENKLEGLSALQSISARSRLANQPNDKVDEATKIDVGYALKDIEEFNRGNSTFDDTIESIVKNLGYKTTPKNIKAATDHIAASQEDEDQIPVDKDLVDELYGVLESNVNEARSIGKIQKEWAKVTGIMKDTVAKWKVAKGQEKDDLLTQLKTLTATKKELEAELDAAVGLKDADAELVGESSDKPHIEKSDLKKLKKGDKIKWYSPDGISTDEVLSVDGIYVELKSGGVIPYQSIVKESLNEAGVNDPVLIAFRNAKMKREKELAKPKRKPLYGKQREKAEDDLWQISQDLKDLYADRGQMLIDMEQEAEAEGGPIADEYGDKLNKTEDEIQKLIAKRTKLEMRLAESFINEEDYSDEMTYGQLERCIDYATMLRERYDDGFSFDPWMHSAVNTAKNELNSVFDALDGGDGVVEGLELTEGLMSDLHQMAKEVKDEEEFVKQFFKRYGDKVKENPKSIKWVKSLYKDTVNEAAQQGEWIAYTEHAKGKKLVKALKSHRAAVRWLNKNTDDLLMQDGVEGIGVISKKDWDLKHAKYAIESKVAEAVTNIKVGDLVAHDESGERYIVVSKPSKTKIAVKNKKGDEKVLSTHHVTLVQNEELTLNEAKRLERDEMMVWLEDYLSTVRTSEEFDGSEDGIWTSGESGDTYKNEIIYDYYSGDTKNREFGVLNKWEKELNKRGWYSEWYDPGTVMIWRNW